MHYTATTSQGESVTFALETLPQAFATIPEPRRKQGTRYSVAAILSLALAAVLAQLVLDAQQQAELSVAPQALRQFDWQGRVLTGDAL